VIKSHQIAGWDNFPLADWIADLVGLPAVLGMTPTSPASPRRCSRRQRFSPVVYITIGSGIGGGLIINGEIYRGIGRGAAEIGHLRVRICRERRQRWKQWRRAGACSSSSRTSTASRRRQPPPRLLRRLLAATEQRAKSLTSPSISWPRGFAT